MRELAGTAVNYNLAVKLGGESPGIAPMAEVVLITSEPEYNFEPDGSLAKQRQTAGVVRFTAGVAALRALAAHATEWADVMEGMQLRIEGRDLQAAPEGSGA